jgi:hypothetical protein
MFLLTLVLLGKNFFEPVRLSLCNPPVHQELP